MQTTSPPWMTIYSLDAERPIELRFVWTGSALNPNFDVGGLEAGPVDNRRISAVILIASFEGRVVAAFPNRTWNKASGKRLLHSKPFSQPLKVEVVSASPDDRTVPGEKVKVWVGLLEPQIRKPVMFDQEAEPDIQFVSAGAGATPALPFAEVLVQVANEHFAFLTPRRGSIAGPRGWNGRPRFEHPAAVEGPKFRRTPSQAWPFCRQAKAASKRAVPLSQERRPVRLRSCASCPYYRTSGVAAAQLREASACLPAEVPPSLTFRGPQLRICLTETEMPTSTSWLRENAEPPPRPGRGCCCDADPHCAGPCKGSV